MDRDSLLIKMLRDNLAYKDGESIALIEQWESEDCPDWFKKKFGDSKKFCEAFRDATHKNGVKTDYFGYHVEEYNDGADAHEDLASIVGKKDIVIMPTAFSLTHTKFRKQLTDAGARVASMPGFTLEMLPALSAERESLVALTSQTYESLSKASEVQIIANGTYMRIPILKETVNREFGIIDKPGMYDNLPGAETFAVPTKEAHGFFTVPEGFGGPFALPCATQFFVKEGKIFHIDYDPTHEKFFQERINPVVFGGENYNVLAEIGIGTNPAATVDLIKKIGWSDLLAEKIYGSVHFANGNSKGLGGDNDVPVHNDWVVPGVKIEYIN